MTKSIQAPAGARYNSTEPINRERKRKVGKRQNTNSPRVSAHSLTFSIRGEGLGRSACNFFAGEASNQIPWDRVSEI